FSLAEAVMPLVFALLILHVGWRTSWGIAALIAIVAGVCAAALVARERDTTGDADEPAVQHGLKSRHWTRRDVLSHWLFWVALPGLMAYPVFATTWFFQQVHLSELRGWALTDYTTLLPIYTLSSLVMLVVSGPAVDRFGVTRLLPFYLVPAAIGFAVAGVGDSLTCVAISLALLGVTQGSIGTVLGVFWPVFFGTRHLGSVRSMASSLMIFSTALGPLVSGAMIDSGVELPVQYLAISLLLLAAAGGLSVVAVGARRMGLPSSGGA
ncbi:MFS transporter, partial [Gammaproteobacteria bacterium]|nr:MFS transporter [Gammaproteobacteria bacterium]